MKSRRKITDPICFYTTHEMRSDIEQMAEEMGYTISELMREIVTNYVKSSKIAKLDNEKDLEIVHRESGVD